MTIILFMMEQEMNAEINQIEFNEEEHRYTYKGKELKGITSAIGEYLGKKYAETSRIKLASIYGTDVHKEVENYFGNKNEPSTEAGKWVIATLSGFMNNLTSEVENIKCEVMVSDFKTTASKVDVVLTTKGRKAYLFDIKTTSKFDREYCSLQLSIYKKLYEICYDYSVQGLYVLGTKSKRQYRIIEETKSKTDYVLSLNGR